MNKDINILLAVPTDCNIHVRTSVTASLLAQQPNVTYIAIQSKPHDYARNNMVRLLLDQKQFTHLLMLDSDINPPLDIIERLVALDWPLASGIYPVLMPAGLRWAIANEGTDGKYRLLDRLPDTDHSFVVDAAGAGCLLISRDIFDILSWPWFKWIENPDGSQMSEDIYFFHQANIAGLRVAVDPQVICQHYKTVNLTDLMMAKERNLNRKETDHVD